MLQRGEVALLGSGASRWGTRENIFGEDGGGGRQGEERVEQQGEWERCDLGEGERVERLEREEIGVAGSERLVFVRVAESKERCCR